MSEAVHALVYSRLGQISAKILRLAERFAAGEIWSVAVRRVSVGTRVQSLSYPRPAPIWPRKKVWLVAMDGYRAAGHGLQFQHLLGHPDMVALLTACPQAARIMLPMCRMLGVETSLLYPGAPARPVVEKVVRPKRVRAKVVPWDLPRIPLPRGVLSACRRAGFYPDP
jgi:hypothetical protein